MTLKKTIGPPSRNSKPPFSYQPIQSIIFYLKITENYSEDYWLYVYLFESSTTSTSSEF